MGRRLQYLESLPTTPSQSERFLSKVKNSIHQSNSSRRLSYLDMNPSLEIHPSTDPKSPLIIAEQNRIALTRLRLGSHYLRIETGRWSRIPRENRLCHCQRDIQMEEHVLLSCTISDPLRIQMNINAQTLSDLFKDTIMTRVAEYCKLILSLFRTLPK